ncbi:hypothetical protein [Rhodopseudomonas palustris]|uniref:Uncharacterized protein n=1 Tax=Rhodopseudomonas palustris (strain DX-1) TaxID=652103 RepID=E6VHE9_RHOPX|nr:hypothetical protein [Rhodopseudomonas palustris]QDL98555.1 hypothetical protein FLL57_15115 [Rhodopseudomonas palustris]
MTEIEIAQQVLSCLHQTESAEPRSAVSTLKGLISYIHGAGNVHSCEVDEARSSTFMAICEYAKALHRGLPADGLRPAAIDAAEKWRALAG